MHPGRRTMHPERGACILVGIPCPGELYRIQSADPLPVTLPHWIQSGKSCRARGADRLAPCRDPSEGRNQIPTPGCCERGSPHPPTRSQQPHSGTGQQPTAKELTTTARAHRAAHGLTGAQQSTTGTAATTATRELNIDQLNFQPSEFRTAPAAIPADSLTGDQIQSDGNDSSKGADRPRGYGGEVPPPYPLPYYNSVTSQIFSRNTHKSTRRY